MLLRLFCGVRFWFVLCRLIRCLIRVDVFGSFCVVSFGSFCLYCVRCRVCVLSCVCFMLCVWLVCFGVFGSVRFVMFVCVDACWFVLCCCGLCVVIVLCGFSCAVFVVFVVVVVMCCLL